MHSKAFNSFSIQEYGKLQPLQPLRPLALIRSSEILPGVSRQANKGPKHTTGLTSAIFQVFGVGLNYNPYAGYGLPFAAGFLISKKLFMTTNSAVPSPEHAHLTLIKLPGCSQNFRLSPNLYFFTNIQKNFTICAVEVLVEKVQILRMSGKFKLFRTSPVKIVNHGLVTGTVRSVNSGFFTFTCPGDLLPGSPIFSERFKLQGLLITSDSLNREKKAVRIDSTLQILIEMKNLTVHQDLQEIIGKTSSMASLPSVRQRIGDVRELFWVQTRTHSVFRFEIRSACWSQLELENLSSLLKSPKWSFKENSRTIILPDASFLIVGGENPSNGEPLGETLQVFPASRMIYKKNSMLEGRSSFSIVYRAGFLYAIGGSARGVTCERFSILTDRWEPFASLNKNRKNASACLFLDEKYILVFGGEGKSGRSIERYSFEFDKWEVLSVGLPAFFINAGLFLYEKNKVLVLGGKASEMVLVLEMDLFVKEHANKVVDETFRIFQLDVLPHMLVTWNAPLFIWNRGILVFLNERWENKPDVFEFQLKKLTVLNLQPLSEVKNTSVAGAKIPNVERLLTPEYFDSYF
jgi:hypothetical protein